MEKHEKKDKKISSLLGELFVMEWKMEKHEREGAIYILAIIGLVASILILVSLTHVLY
jgi:hypothetical protein